MMRTSGIRLPEDKIAAVVGGDRHSAPTTQPWEQVPLPPGSRARPPAFTPRHAEQLLSSALAAFDEGNYPLAEKIYGTPGLFQGSTRRAALLGLGASIDMQGRYEDSLPATRQFIRESEAIGDSTDLHRGYANLANSLLALGRRAEARPAIDKALEIAPTDEIAREISRQIG